MIVLLFYIILDGLFPFIFVWPLRDLITDCLGAENLLMQAVKDSHINIFFCIMRNWQEVRLSQAAVLRAIHFTASRGETRMLDAIRNKTGINGGDELLVSAASSGNINTVYQLLSEKSDEERRRLAKNRCYSVLSAAISSGNCWLVRFLEEQGFDIRCMSNEALMIAASRGDSEMVRELLGCHEAKPTLDAARAAIDAGRWTTATYIIRCAS